MPVVEREASTAFDAAKTILKQAGYVARTIYAVWSVGESDLGGETILFVTPAGEPRTAVLRDNYLRVWNGW